MSSFKKLRALVLIIGLTAAACGSDPEVTEDSTAVEGDSTETTEAMADE